MKRLYTFILWATCASLATARDYVITDFGAKSDTTVRW